MSDQSELEQSAAELTASLENDPLNTASLFRLGYVLKSLGRFKEALVRYETLIRIKPDHHEALHAIGNAYFRMKQPLKAIEYYKRAVEIWEHEPDFFVDLAEAFWSVGDFQEAAAALEVALPLCLPGEEAVERIHQLLDEIDSSDSVQ